MITALDDPRAFRRPKDNNLTVPPELIAGTRRTPGFDIFLGISTPHQRFAFARLSGSYLTGSSPAFCCNAHHHRF
jgi:hypothetical protein